MGIPSGHAPLQNSDVVSEPVLSRLKHVRITIAQMPLLLRDIVVASLGQARDIEILETPTEPMQLGDLVTSARPDVLVVACEGAELRRLLDELLWRYADLRVLAISPDGRRAFLSELRLHEVELLDISPQSLLEAIRRPGGGEVTV